MTAEKAGAIMGGRGGASGFPTNAPVVPAGPQSAAETKDLNELAQYMSNVGITVDTASLSGLTFENVRDAAAGIERIIKEFPQAVLSFNQLKGQSLKHGVLACASYGGNIMLGEHYFSKTEDGLNRTYDNSTSKGFHPAGTTKTDIATHEAGHVLDSALIHKMIPGNDFYSRLERAEAWNKGKIAGKVVSEACRAAKKTPEGKGKKNDELIRSVSGYATKNRSETLAECVADYAANGANAKPLSVAVWNILKRELG